jgi:hypothetical protein
MGISSGEVVEIRSNNPVSLYAFNTSKVVMDYPEDPNHDYSPVIIFHSRWQL